MRSLTINGQTRTGDVREKLLLQAERMRETSLPHAERAAAVLALGKMPNEQAFLAHYLSLLREDCSVRLDTLEPPCRPGVLGAAVGAVRKLLWRILRPHLELATWRQNAINADVMHALEFLRLASQAPQGWQDSSGLFAPAPDGPVSPSGPSAVAASAPEASRS